VFAKASAILTLNGASKTLEFEMLFGDPINEQAERFMLLAANVEVAGKYVFQGSSGVANCQIAPALPPGLSLTTDSDGCKISGTPSSISEDRAYSLTALDRNSQSLSADVNIQINHEEFLGIFNPSLASTPGVVRIGFAFTSSSDPLAISVDWGDGNEQSYTRDQLVAVGTSTAYVEHTYLNANINYSVRISGQLKNLYIQSGGRDTLIEIQQWGQTTASNAMLTQAVNLARISASDFLYFGDSGNLDSLFSNCRSLTEIVGIESWNTSLVSNFNRVFNGTPLLDANLSSWDFSNLDRRGIYNLLSLPEGMSSANYDALLDNLAGYDSLPANIRLEVGAANYSSAAITNRAKLISDYGWTINDGGQL
jgi:hypothetical protein